MRKLIAHDRIVRRRLHHNVCYCCAAESLLAELRLVLHDCFQAFTSSAKSAAGLLPQPAEPTTELDEDQPDQLAEPLTQPLARPQKPAVSDAQLLLHHSNCAYVRTKVLSHVLSRRVCKA